MYRGSCFIGLLMWLFFVLAGIAPVRAMNVDCTEHTAPATFILDNGILCLQKIIIEEQADMVFYTASLAWSGPDNPNQFSLLNTGLDNSSDLNSPFFSTINGSLTLPKVDVPGTYGTERYAVNLALADEKELSLFEIASISVYINPDFIPNVTWKPYGMLDREERHAVDLLGRSLPYAKLADAVYDFDNTLVDQWILVETKDNNSGMQAGVYYDPVTDEVVLAFRGTETCDFPCSLSELAELALDTAADTLLTFGLVDTQFEDAMDYARDVVARAQDRKVIVTGHSLGGGLAQAVGSALGLEAFAFNSAPVPDDFFDNYPPVLPPVSLNEIIHVLGDIHDPVSNTDETGKFYRNAMHVSTLIQFDFDMKEILPPELRQLNELRFNRHSITRLVDNASALLMLYQDGW
ncbi:Lipase (class 3) [Nitrosomonas sp. Nm51]|uniref:lipase family protein n=1 Tax=Nitrosomonas sp. Nm51 TaxID=133720 RepID=UPI0008C9FAF0|nr:lipase [Nitrosomonas sp. Nm51]SER29199.1 Lipase (class 3) [Nitrosomonas sp. Nm51]